MNNHSLIHYAERYAQAVGTAARAKQNFTSYARLKEAIRKRDAAEREMREVLGTAQVLLKNKENSDD